MQSLLKERLHVLGRHLGSPAAYATPPLQQNACEAQPGDGKSISAGAAAALVEDNAVITVCYTVFTFSRRSHVDESSSQHACIPV